MGVVCGCVLYKSVPDMLIIQCMYRDNIIVIIYRYRYVALYNIAVVII